MINFRSERRIVDWKLPDKENEREGSFPKLYENK